MTIANSGSLVTKDLAFYVDAAGFNSFLGTPASNAVREFRQSSGVPGEDQSYYKAFGSFSEEYIPALGWAPVQNVDVWNNYPDGWTGCCPNLFYYGNPQNITGNTLYTYQIIYKTSDGYTHPNYLYRYEFNSSGTYLTEGGVFDNSRRVDLGNDWYMAWGQFTSQPTATQMNLYSFHYKYKAFTRMQVAAILLNPSSIVLPAKHMFIQPQTTRGTNINSEGGWLDLSGNNNHGTLSGNPTYTTSNGGGVVFNGTSQFSSFNIANLNFDREQTIIMVLKKTGNFSNRQNPWNQNYGGYGSITFETNGVFNYYWGSAGADTTPYDQITSSFSVANNELAFIALTRSSTSLSWYKNGVLDSVSVKPNTGIPRAFPGNTTLQIGLGYAGYFSGEIYYTSAYTRALSASEIKQNFDALKGRFNLS
jgi:hypothetical protein